MPKTLGRNPRPTAYISRRVTQSGFRGFDYAAASGRPLNRYVVLHLLEDEKCLATVRFAKILHKFRDWLAYKAKKTGRPMAPVYVLTFENPSGSVHANWAVHVPPGLEGEFEAKLKVWVRRVQGEGSPSDLHVQPIDAAYAKRLAKYIFKGTDPVYVNHFHLGGVHEPQGLVWGRRATISQAIGVRARKRAGFHPGKRAYQPLPASDWRGVTHSPSAYPSASPLNSGSA